MPVRVDLAAGCVALALSLGTCYGARAMPMGTVGNPGPGFLPFWIGVTLAMMSVALIVGSLAGGRSSDAPVAGARRGVAGIAGGLLLYAAVLETVGYLVATFALLAALLVILGERRWPAGLAFAALATAATWAMFGVWLGVPLPAGTLFR